MHQFTAYDEYKYRLQRRYRWRDGISDNHAWNPSAIRTLYQRYYVGETSATTSITPRPITNMAFYPFVWGDAITKVFNREPTLLAEDATTDGAGGGTNSKTILTTQGAVVQSHFLSDRIVTTLACAKTISVKFGLANSATVPLLKQQRRRQHHLTTTTSSQMGPGRLARQRRKNETSGFVVKTVPRRHGVSKKHERQRRRRPFLRRDARRPLAQLQQIRQLHAADARAGSLLHPLPNSSGEGTDYGFTFNVFDGRFVIRANHWENKSLNCAQRRRQHDQHTRHPHGT